MTREAKETAGAVFAGMGFLAVDGLGVDGGEIGVENHGAVEFYPGAGALNGNFLEIPFTDRVLITAGGGDHTVGGAVSLAGIDGAFYFFVVVVENLEFAHADVGRVAGAGIADGEAVVAAGWELKVEPRLKIGERGIPVNRAAFVFLPNERAVFDRHGFEWAGPTVEVFTIKNRAVAGGAVAREQAAGFFATDFADVEIAPAGFAAVGLEFDRAADRDGALLVPWEFFIVIVFEERVVDDELIVEPDGDTSADHDDAETIPLPDGLISADEWVPTGRFFIVVPEAAGAESGAIAVGVRLGGIPDLDLGDAAQVDAGVGAGGDFPIHEQFKIAVVALRGGVAAEAIVQQFAGINGPVGATIFEGGEAGGPLRNLGGALCWREAEEFAVVIGVAAAPAGQVSAVK